MSTLLDSTTDLNSTPVIVYFQRDTGSVNLTVIAELELRTDSKFVICSSWNELAAAVEQNPTLIVFHIDRVRRHAVTIAEFAIMIQTLSRYMLDNTRTPIAVAIEKTCTVELVKELRDTDILGIVPAAAAFGKEATATAINVLKKLTPYWPKEIISQLVTENRSNKNNLGPGSRLTVRQRQIAELICNRGLTNKKVAGMLKITESTVKSHVSAILKEYGVRNRTQLVLAVTTALRA